MKKREVAQTDTEDKAFIKKCDMLILNAVYVTVLMAIMLVYEVVNLVGKTAGFDSWFGGSLEEIIFYIAFGAITLFIVHMYLAFRVDIKLMEMFRVKKAFKG